MILKKLACIYTGQKYYIYKSHIYLNYLISVSGIDIIVIIAIIVILYIYFIFYIYLFIYLQSSIYLSIYLGEVCAFP